MFKLSRCASSLVHQLQDASHLVPAVRSNESLLMKLSKDTCEIIVIAHHPFQTILALASYSQITVRNRFINSIVMMCPSSIAKY